MSVIYNSKKIIPAPFVSIQKKVERYEDGRRKRSVFSIVAEGTISLQKGSPDEDGDLWTTSGYPPDTVTLTDDNRLAIMREKQGALMNLFEQDGMWFEIQPYDGSAPIKFQPRVGEISFEKGDWYSICKYSIPMEADSIFYGDLEISGVLSEVDESWSIEATDDKNRAYKITHQLAASRKNNYDVDGSVDTYGWELAKIDVVEAMGYENNFNRTLSGFTEYNHAYTESIDVSGGKYSISETWFVYDGGVYFEDYSASTKYQQQEGVSTVNIEGTITGLSTTSDSFGDRYTNAQTGWTAVQALLLSRAQSISGLTLNANPMSYSIGKNPKTGVITYQYEYSTKAGTTISGALWEQFTLVNNFATPVIAQHVCIARSIGPVLQEIGTQTVKKRSLSIEVQMEPATGTPPTYPSQPDVTSVISDNTPSSVVQGPYVDRNEESWVKQTGRYTRNISWFWI